MEKEIIKLKNFEGRYFRCQCCNKEIKHAYKIKGENKIYGSECVKTLVSNSTAQIKKQNDLHKRLEKILLHKSVYGWDNYKNAYGYNDDQMSDHFLNKGGF